MQADLLPLQRLEYAQGVERRAKHAVELRDDDNIALLDRRQQLLPLGPLVQWARPRHPAFDEHPIQCPALLHGVAVQLAALDVQALALISLAVGRNAAIAVKRPQHHPVNS
jgi:hypothetical protein